MLWNSVMLAIHNVNLLSKRLSERFIASAYNFFKIVPYPSKDVHKSNKTTVLKSENNAGNVGTAATSSTAISCMSFYTK